MRTSAPVAPRLVALALAALLAVGLAGCTRKTGGEVPPAQMTCATGQPATNLDETYGFCVPTGWRVLTYVEGVEFRVMAPEESEFDTFLESVYVTRMKVLDNTTLEEFKAYQLSNIVQLPNATFVASENRTLGGVAAFSIEFTGEQGGEVRHFVQVMAVREGKAYILQYTAQEGRQLVFTPGADLVWGSFRFL